MAAVGSLFRTGGFGMHVSLDMFFDRAGTIAAMDEKSNRCMSSAGAFGKTVMQRGMRRRKAISDPGNYPSAHPGNPLLREKVRFGFDKDKKSLVVGPALLDSTDPEVAAAGFTVPELVNFGGTVERRSTYDPLANRIKRISNAENPVRWLYQPRPFVELTQPKVEKKLLDNLERFTFRKNTA